MTRFRVRQWLVFGFWVVWCGLGWAESVAALNHDGLRLLKENDYAGAVAAFAEAKRRAPGNATLRHNHVAALNAWAVWLDQEKHHEAAVERIERALRLDPDDPTLRKNATNLWMNHSLVLTEKADYEQADRALVTAAETATASDRRLIEQRRAENLTLWGRKLAEGRRRGRAQSLLEQALGLDSTCVPALLELAGMLYDDGHTAKALAYWELVYQQRPEMPGLQERIDRVRREMEAEAGFEYRSSRHFTVSYEGERNAAAAETILEILETARRRLGRELNYQPQHRVQVVVYTEQQYSRVTLAPHWAAAMYDGKIRVPVHGEPGSGGQKERLRQMLYHEYVHALVHAAGGSEVPTWLNEGLATYYEHERRERRERHEEEIRSIAQLAREGILVTVSSLPASFFEERNPEIVKRYYLVSRGFTGWLIDRYHPYRVCELLEHMGNGQDFETAIESSYHQSLKTLEQRWQEALRRY